MILTIPGGAQQAWGSPVWLKVSGAVIPPNTVDYSVWIAVKYLDGDGRFILDSYYEPDANGKVEIDISSLIKSPGLLQVQWGEFYLPYPGNGQGGVKNEFVNDYRSIQVVNQTTVEVGSVTIPGGPVQLSGNPIVIKVKTTAAKMAGKSNYRLALRVTCPQLMGSPFPAELIAPDKKDLTAVFDISGFVDQPVAHTFDYPAIGACNPHDPLVFHLTIDTGEVYTDANGDRQEVWNGDLTGYQMRVIKGKLRPYELALLNEVGKSFHSEYIQGGKFLTHLPNFQKVAPRHIPMLWYLSRWTENHPFTAHLKIKTADNQVHELTQDFVLYDITGLVDFAFQPAHWGFYQDNVVSYEFWLSDAAGNISEHRTYLVDRTYYERSFTFYYLNPLSGVDLIWLTGEHSEKLKTESEIAYRPVPFGSGSKVASLATIQATGQRSWELNTGAKTREEILALRDFLESRERWMVDPDNETRLIPVIIESGDFKLTDSLEDIPNFDLKIMEAH